MEIIATGNKVSVLDHRSGSRLSMTCEDPMQVRCICGARGVCVGASCGTWCVCMGAWVRVCRGGSCLC